MSFRRVCVFAGSRPGVRPSYIQAAERLGRLLAERGIGLVYGGGRIGMMGALADAALEGGGEVIGIIPEGLVFREQAHASLAELHVVGSLHERKRLMADLSEAFVALPGGFGTLDELTEMITWSQLEVHAKAVGLLNVERFYDPLLSFLERAIQEGFIAPEHAALVTVEADPAGLLDALAATGLPAPAPGGLGPGEV